MDVTGRQSLCKTGVSRKAQANGLQEVEQRSRPTITCTDRQSRNRRIKAIEKHGSKKSYHLYVSRNLCCPLQFWVKMSWLLALPVRRRLELHYCHHSRLPHRIPEIINTSCPWWTAHLTVRRCLSRRFYTIRGYTTYKEIITIHK